MFVDNKLRLFSFFFLIAYRLIMSAPFPPFPFPPLPWLLLHRLLFEIVGEFFLRVVTPLRYVSSCGYAAAGGVAFDTYHAIEPSSVYHHPRSSGGLSWYV